MLRSRSVSAHRIRRSAASLIAFALSLSIASRASAGTPVVVAGPDGSARAGAIASELRARGFDVTEDATLTTPPSSTATVVRVDPDGSVVVVAGARQETFAADEGDASLARRVAEAIRATSEADRATAPPAAPPPAPSKPAANAMAPVATPVAAPGPARAMAPARTFASSGTWLVSVDDALPLLAIGGAGAPLTSERVLRIGDPTYGVGSTPKPMSLDFAVADRVTIGGTAIVQHGADASIIGASGRVGYVLPLSNRIALWPRLGVATAASMGGDWSLLSRTDVVAEARVVWTVTPSWALTVGPSLALPVQEEARPAPTPLLVPLGFDPAFGASPESAPTRIGLAIGITGRIGGGSDEHQHATSSAEPRWFLGIERVLPLFRYRIDTADTNAKAAADGGTTDVTPITPQSPRLAVDVRIVSHLTLGVAGSVGMVRTSTLATSLVPGSTAPVVVAWTVAPRVGWRAPLTKALALWPRLGLTYADATASRNDTSIRPNAHHLGADLDAFAVLSPVEGVGFVFGPSIELPLAGARPTVTTVDLPAGSGVVFRNAIVGRREQAILTVAMSAGLVVSLP